MSPREAAETPLVEQLRSVPKDARQILCDTSKDFAESRNIPYGRMCHEAADQIEALRDALAEANPMQCEHCGIKFADKQPGSLCPKCYREVTKAESAAAESVVNQQLTTELSDEEIINLWTADDVPMRVILDFGRAVLAARGKG